MSVMQVAVSFSGSGAIDHAKLRPSLQPDYPIPRYMRGDSNGHRVQSADDILCEYSGNAQPRRHTA
jgi:hypothetical protein